VNTAFDRRRVSCDIAVKGTDDVRSVKQLLERTVRSGVEGVDLDPVATVLLVRIVAEAMIFRIRWWSNAERGEYLIVQDRVLTAVFEALRGAKLVVA
jgi:small-conductance mechanosensitive channel